MKKEYEELKMEVIAFETKDVITASTEDTTEPGPSPEPEPTPCENDCIM